MLPGREGAFHQTRHHHDVPLQPLGGMDGEDLHRLGRGLHSGPFEPALFGDRGVQPGEEPDERRAVSRRRKIGRDIGKCVQVRPGGVGCVAGSRQHLDIKPEGTFSLAHEVGQRECGLAPQSSQRSGQSAQPSKLSHPDVLALGPAPHVWGEIVEGFDNARLVEHLGSQVDQLVGRVVQPLVLVAVTWVEVERESAECFGLDDPLAELGPRVQSVEVRGAEPTHRAGQQPHEGVAATRIGNRPQRRDEVEDLGGEQQAPQPDHFVGDVGLVQCLHDRTELRTLAAQHRCRRPRAAARLRQPGGQVCRLLQMGADPRHRDVPGTGVGPDRQRGHIDPGRGTQRRRKVVGHPQDRRVVAPRRGQLPHRRRGSVGELRREARQRRRAGTAPPVDRLVGVTDRRDRDSPVPGGEQRPQQDQLGLGRVLELVEQHHPEPRPLRCADVGETQGESRGQGNLVGEVDRVPRALERGEGVDDGQQRPARAERCSQFDDVLRSGSSPRRERRRVDGCDDPIELVTHLVGPDEVFGQLPRKVDDRPDRRRLGVAHLRHVTVVAGHRLGGILPRGRLGQQPRVGLIAKPEGVLADEATGIRVVGRDGRGAAENLRPLFVGRWRP